MTDEFGPAVPPPDIGVIEQVAASLDLREPNKAAVRTIAQRLFEHSVMNQSGYFEGVVDAAVGLGKTYIAAGAIDYFVAMGYRNFAIIAPGLTILDKTIQQFSVGTSKSLVGGMSVEPLVIHAGNFNSAAMGAELANDDRVKLFVFSVQSLLQPGTKQGRRTHEFQEGLGKAFYAHLEGLDDLVVFADEHHCYNAPKFSDAVRGLRPLALIGLTATPDKRSADKVIFQYPLAAAIAEKFVKVPVIVGRKDENTGERAQLLDGAALLLAKERVLTAYCDANGLPFVHPVMLVTCRDIEHAQEVVGLVRSDQFHDGRFVDAVLEVHSDNRDEALRLLDTVDDIGSPVRIIVQVGMLREGWDCKHVYVMVSLRSSVSDVLTEQTLGRGMRLPFGQYVEHPLLNELEVVAHESYRQLLDKSKALTERFIDYRTEVTAAPDGDGTEQTFIQTTQITTPVVPLSGGQEDDEGQAELHGSVAVGTVEERIAQVQQAAEQVRPLLPLTDISIPIPEVHSLPVAVDVSLANVEEAPFRELGRQLAVEPDKYLARTKIGAEVIHDRLRGEREVRLTTAEADVRVEAVASTVPMEEALESVVNDVTRLSSGPARRGKREHVARLVGVVLDGAGEGADTVLSSYPRSLINGTVRMIGNEVRRLTSTAQNHEVAVVAHPFTPRPRLARPEASGDLHGRFVGRGKPYAGWSKAAYEQAWFDSRLERDMACVLDQSDAIQWWVRLHLGDLPILWGSTHREYNPDFVALDTDGVRWIIETKADKDMTTDEVLAKKQSATAWVREVNADGTHGEWKYILVPEGALADGVNVPWARIAGLAV